LLREKNTVKLKLEGVINFQSVNMLLFFKIITSKMCLKIIFVLCYESKSYINLGEL